MNENEIKKSSALEPVVGFLKNNSMVLIFLVLAVFLGASSGNSFSSLGADASIDGSWLKWLLEQSGTQAQTICNMARELWSWTLDVFTKESRLRIPGIV